MLYELSNCENKISLTKVFFGSPFTISITNVKVDNIHVKHKSVFVKNLLMFSLRFFKLLYL